LNQVLHDGIYVGVACCSSGTADYSVAANALQKQKQHQDWIVLYTKTGMGDGQQVTLGYKSFRSNYKSFGIIMLQYLMQMLKNTNF
jgi:hypothetical protein